jgi:hypothetical protein
VVTNPTRSVCLLVMLHLLWTYKRASSRAWTFVQYNLMRISGLHRQHQCISGLHTRLSPIKGNSCFLLVVGKRRDSPGIKFDRTRSISTSSSPKRRGFQYTKCVECHLGNHRLGSHSDLCSGKMTSNDSNPKFCEMRPPCGQLSGYCPQ